MTYGVKKTFAGSEYFNVNENNNNDFYDYFYDQFLFIVNKSISEVNHKRKVNVEVVTEVIHEIENIYYKNCLKLEDKDDIKIISDEIVV